MLGNGLHLVIDGETAVPLALPRVERFLRHFPRYIGMRRFTDPMVYQNDDGCCGIVGIVESHCSVHSRGVLIWVDIFSCGYMNTEKATRGVVRLLGLTQYRAKVLQRPLPAPTLGGPVTTSSTFGPTMPRMAAYAHAAMPKRVMP